MLKPRSKSRRGDRASAIEGRLFFIAAPEKMLLGDDVKGSIGAQPEPALILLFLFAFGGRGLRDLLALLGLFDLLDLLDVVFVPDCQLLILDGMALL